MTKIKRKKAEKHISGYFTVEASFIVPIAALIIAFLIYVAFLLYGRCIMAQDAYRIAFGASKQESLADPTAYAQQAGDELFGSRYFGNGIPTVQAWKAGDMVHVKLKTDTEHRIMDMSTLMPSRGWVSSYEAQAEVIRPAARIRRLQRVSDIAREVINK